MTTARGLKEMHDAGAWTVARTKPAAWSMACPEAVKLGWVDKVLSLTDIPAAILGRISRRN